MTENMLDQIEADSTTESAASGSMDYLMALAEEMESLKGATDELKEELKERGARYDELRKKMIPEEMAKVGLVNDAGLGKFSLASGATISLRGDLFVQIIREELENAHSWLEEEGHGHLIKPNVNPQTLRAFAKEQMGEGKELPKDFFNVHPFSTATIRRK